MTYSLACKWPHLFAGAGKKLSLFIIKKGIMSASIGLPWAIECELINGAIPI